MRKNFIPDPNLLGIIGGHLEGSVSTVFYNRLFKRFELPYAYLPFQIEKQDLKNLIVCMRLLGLTGINVTIPYKEEVLKVLKRLDVSGKLCGAVNTIVKRGEDFVGYNTDGLGWQRAFERVHGGSPSGRAVTLLGAGGAARAIGAALGSCKANKVFIVNRTLARARRLASFFNSRFDSTEFKAVPWNFKFLEMIFPETEILIQATSLGFLEPFRQKLPLRLLDRDSLVSDIVYRPHFLTPILRQARRLNLPILDGLWMFVYQAQSNLKLWTGQSFEPRILRQLALTGLESTLKGKNIPIF